MQNIIAIENGVTRHPLYRMKRGRKKYIGRYDYRSVAVVDERSEI